MKFLRAIPVLAVGVLVFMGTTHIAHADPHAVFYTAIGQQQLFFNVLAALDQADYVEPKSGASGLSREELLRDRSDTEFGNPSDDNRLTTTRTNLSSVLTRNITLEGYDLWTAYQLQNRANDFQRRIGVSEYARLLCQHALGIPLCNTEDFSAYSERANAIVTDPVERALLPIERGALAVLLSGSPHDQEIRRQIVASEQNKKDPFSWEYNSAIAAAWEAVSGDTQKQELLDSMLSDTLTAFVPAQVDPSVYDNIASINPDGTINHTYRLAGTVPAGTVLAQESRVLEGLDFTAQYISDMYSAIRNQGAALETAKAAQENVKNEQGSDNEGFKAIKEFSDYAGGGLGGAIGRIAISILTPAESRVAATKALKDAGVIADTSIESAPIEGQYVPGTTPLLNKPFPPEGSVQGVQQRSPDVLGVQSGSVVQQAQSSGRVAGILSPGGGLLGSFLDWLWRIIFSSYDAPQDPVPIQGEEANIEPAHSEQGLEEALTAFDPGFSDADTRGGGFGASTQGLWPQYCAASSLCN